VLLVHEDADREFDYTSGAEQVLEKADKSGWTVAASITTGPPSSRTRTRA
jgi:hypothetical protein